MKAGSSGLGAEVANVHRYHPQHPCWYHFSTKTRLQPNPERRFRASCRENNLVKDSNVARDQHHGTEKINAFYRVTFVVRDIRLENRRMSVLPAGRKLQASQGTIFGELPGPSYCFARILRFVRALKHVIDMLPC